MEVKTVKISDKGQISIPKDVREEMKLKEGETLIMISERDKITLKRAADFVSRKEGANTMLASESVLKKDWDNKYDERWNKY
jgi:AbrB family looped-hinge helix DNA binding protein